LPNILRVCDYSQGKATPESLVQPIRM